MALTETEGLTLDDLNAMPDDGRRYELLGGTIVVNAAPSPRHQRALFQLAERLNASRPPGHEVFFAPLGLDLVGEQRVEPDLMVVPSTSVGDHRLSLPVLLVVELLSPATVVWDTVAKRDAYAQSGIEHYWTVDTRPGHQRFTSYRLSEGSATYEVVADRTDRVVAADPVHVDVDLADLFRAPN